VMLDAPELARKTNISDKAFSCLTYAATIVFMK
jgi:hypothetical protein